MSRLLWLSSLIYLLTLLGFAQADGRLLALTIPLVVYLAAAVLLRPADPQIQLTRSLSTDRTAPNRPVTVTLTIHNDGPAIEECLIADPLPAGLTLFSGRTSQLLKLPAGATLELTYQVTARRGLYHFGDVEITGGELLGLLPRQVTLPTPGRLFVTPETLHLRAMTIRPRQTRVYAGLIPARQGGPGVEFFGVRAYQPGDTLRRVNWRANARHPDHFYANDFEQERVADVGLIVDARQRSNLRSTFYPDTLFEYNVQAAAALAEAFLQDGNRVGLLLYGDLLDWTLPGYGKIQGERIRQALARARPGDSLVFDRLEHLPTRLFPPKSQLILVSPLLADDVPFLARLRGRGYSLLVISPDSITYEVGPDWPRDQRPEWVLATRLARLERATLLRQVRQAGIHVLNWSVGAPLDQAIHAFPLALAGRGGRG